MGDGVALGTDVTVTFDEPVVPPTDWDSAVTLRAVGAGTDVPAVVTAEGVVVTLDPTDDLAAGTVYTVTVDSAVANLSGIPLGADDTWSFTTAAPLSFVTDETAADFGAGSVDAGTSVSVTGDGELTLAPTVGAEFEGAGVPSGWTSTLWAGGSGGSTVGDGAVVVDGALLGTEGTYEPGRSLEFVASFGAGSAQHVGFGVDTDNVARWAMFSTSNTSTTLFVRTHNGSTAASFPLGGGLIGSPHRYRIDWSSGQVLFSVDGTVVHTEPVAISGEMRPVVSDFDAGGPAVSLDWLRMGPYTPSGTFTSRVLDAGALADWRTLEVTDTTPVGHGDQLRGAHRRHAPTPTTGHGRPSPRWSMALTSQACRGTPSTERH